MSNANTNNPGFAVSEAPDLGADPGADLKSLLTAIVSQISDADRRHSDTLHQMQDRLANLSRDAKSLRGRVPDQFQAAFERIEAGVSELANRIADAQHAPAETFAPAFAPAPAFAAPASFATTSVTADDFGLPRAPLNDGVDQSFARASIIARESAEQQPAAADEAPMVLRSAHASPTPKTAKPAQAFDTFDVIESLPGDVTDPWDRDAATALATLYDSDPRSFAQDPYAATPSETPRIYAPAGAANAGTPADQAWLEKRFAEISERIENTLADIRPDQSFFALGQRIDQFERSFTSALDNVATHADVEAVRLIEAHMMELVNHLETTQTQLARIDSIEGTLANIAQRLDEVHAIATAASEQGMGGDAHGQSAAQFDVEAVARAAAQEAASETAARISAQPQELHSVAGLDDVRRLMEQSISNARQSEENTTAVLDTLQQAMIRLLDRMDAIELTQHTAGIATQTTRGAAPQTFAAAPAFMEERREPEPQLTYPHIGDQLDELDEAVAVVASRAAHTSTSSAGVDTIRRETRTAPTPPQAEPPGSEKLRQDFIADARRAKMRLSGEDSDSMELPSPGARELPSVTSRVANVAKGNAASAAPAGSDTVLTPRVVALSVALAIAGAAYVMFPFAKQSDVTAAPIAANEQSMQANGANETRVTPKQRAAKSADASDAPPPDADFSRPSTAPGSSPAQLNLQRTEGRIYPGDMTAAATVDRPLHGIALATADQPSLANVARAQREQAMANVSNRLGEVAATNPSPAALDGSDPTGGQLAALAPQKSGPLDMPPATVGPLSLRLAAANGDPSAEFEVGARLAEGKGTDQNFKDAAKWYQRSATQGFAQAQYRLGTLYERGLGLKTDTPRAKEWYERAAEQGNMKAMHNLAVLSANAKSGTPDYTTAAKWFTDAAQLGLADSQFNLAVLYENGLGVTTDMRQAYKWLSLAARNGDKEATRRRDIMKGKLSAGELSEAEGMVRDFQMRRADPLINDARTAGEAWKKNPANGENG